ncbi:MAG TPA: DsrE family protein [Elusimicrobiota bacterium]|nr:DsrE family protein [Elusimicrobiota bacterium]
MKLGIILYSADAEAVWNALRLSNFSKNQGDEVSVFLVAKGVECENIGTDKYDIKGQMMEFHRNGGKILACGTCLKFRNMPGTEICPLSTMKDLYDIIKTHDKVVSF